MKQVTRLAASHCLAVCNLLAMLGFSDLAAKTFCRAQSFCLFRLCGGRGEEAPKGYAARCQRVAVDSDAGAVSDGSVADCLAWQAGRQRDADPQGFPGLLDAWHSAKLAAGADAAAVAAAAA